MSSLLPFSLSDQTGLSAPTTSGTVEVTGDYTLAAGDSLDIIDPIGFDITATTVHFEIDGAVTVTSAAAAVTGVSTPEEATGSLTMSTGASGSLVVTGSAEGAVVTGVQTEHVEGDYINRGLLQVSAAAGSAYGMVTHTSESFLDNRATLEVSARDQAFGIYIDSNTHANNDGTIKVQAHQAVGVEEIDEGGAVLDNDGTILAVGKGPDGSAIGALTFIGPDIFNQGTIRAVAHGVAAGMVMHGTDSFSNDGAIVGVSKGADLSFGLVLDNGFIASNNGLIKGDIALAGIDVYDLSAGGSDETFTNLGKLAGDVMLGGGDDVLINGSGHFAARILGVVDLGEGNDTFASNHLGILHDSVFGGLGDDSLTGSAHRDTLIGDALDDSLGGGNDVLRGMRGGDALLGGQGDDILVGGAGADTMAGQAGNDTFVFAKLTDSVLGASDLIFDLENTDVIDLHRIDADTTGGSPGDQAFHLVSSFSGAAGELVVSYDSIADQTDIAGDVDGDGFADFAILVRGDHHDFTNFVL